MPDAARAVAKKKLRRATCRSCGSLDDRLPSEPVPKVAMSGCRWRLSAFSLSDIAGADGCPKSRGFTGNEGENTVIQTEALKSRLHGVITALVTPFRNGNVDFPALDNLIEWQLSEGIDGFVVCGTTGEAPTLCKEERIAIIRRAVEVVGGRVPVIAGTGTNDTRSTVAFTAEAASLGIDGVLIVTPITTARHRKEFSGILRPWRKMSKRRSLSTTCRLVPGRSRLAHAAPPRRPEGRGRAEGRDRRSFTAIGRDKSPRRRVPAILRPRRDGARLLPGRGRGTISVISNVAPGLCAQMHKACFEGDIRQAQSIDRQLRPLFAALERETNPGPAKYGLHLLQRASPEVRLPLWRSCRRLHRPCVTHFRKSPERKPATI